MFVPRRTLELVTYTEDEEYEFTWNVDVFIYPKVKATYLDPPEGGPEVDGDPILIAAARIDADGSQLDSWLEDEIPPDVVEVSVGFRPDEEAILEELENQEEK